MTGDDRRRFSVEKFKVESEVLKMSKEGAPATVISKVLAEKNIKITPLGINRWLKKAKHLANQKHDLKLSKEYETIVMNYKTEIMSILDEVKEQKNKAKDDGDLKIYDKMIGRLYQGLELLAKLMGDIKPTGSVDINIVINEISKQASTLNRRMRSPFKNMEPIDVEAEIIRNDEQETEKLNR